MENELLNKGCQEDQFIAHKSSFSQFFKDQ